MATFQDFVQEELPKRVFTPADGTAGQVPVRSGNPLAKREMVFVDPSELVGAEDIELPFDPVLFFNNTIA